IDNGIGDGRPVEAQARKQATERGWLFQRVTGDLVLIRRLLAGDWEEDFLVLAPGQESAMTYDEQVIGCRLLKGNETK
ncbi:MAG: hypothetical protein HY328_11415, partial [Chloroflexi bacterium]|nr:hypothetical protein [Chloroflexota bacterium]